ncbi:MAG: hypothetical protein BWY79_00998 [Actinobacteria bacterium ADurb.Bin444]|nr:MAG: hypothetical protein BWY79_00998 [Actinobacteria bacterium ADurb.Bin444]
MSLAAPLFSIHWGVKVTVLWALAFISSSPSLSWPVLVIDCWDVAWYLASGILVAKVTVWGLVEPAGNS